MSKTEIKIKTDVTLNTRTVKFTKEQAEAMQAAKKEETKQK